MKLVLTTIAATIIATSAFSAPLVFSNGVQLTEAQIIERAKSGDLVGNWTVEDGKMVIASDSKNPVVRYKAAVKEAVRERENSQDKKREVRAEKEAVAKAAREAYEANEKAIGESTINIPDETLAEIKKWVEPFIAAQTEETQAKYIAQLTALKTVNDAREFFNEAYGTDADNTEFFAAIQPKGGDNAEAEGYAIGGATTCALKKLDDGRGCGVGSGT